jgi:hypothetical protein
MKFIGIFHNNNLPKHDYRRLFTYVGNVEVIIFYNEDQPFLVEQIAVLLDNEYRAYDVFECLCKFESDVDAKAYAYSFAENLIQYRKSLSDYIHLDDPRKTLQ